MLEIPAWTRASVIGSRGKPRELNLSGRGAPPRDRLRTIPDEMGIGTRSTAIHPAWPPGGERRRPSIWPPLRRTSDVSRVRGDKGADKPRERPEERRSGRWRLGQTG